MSLNYLLGFTGVLSFGHAAYFGLGAYAAGLTLKLVAPSLVLALLTAAVVGTAAGAIVGALIARLRGVYYAMVTIAFGQVFYFIAYRWNSVTGGGDGLGGFSRPPLDLGPLHVDLLGDERAFYYLALLVVAVATAIQGLLLDSPLGRVQLAIRENERRIRFLGVPVERHVWLAFVVSCLFTSLAGGLYALLNNFADPRTLYWSFSGELVIMVVLGGMRDFWGPLLGAAIFVVLQDYVSSLTENWMSFVGLFFVLVVLFLPRGLLSLVRLRPAT
jgi:branched-chain amino acid transport system permease protein